MAVDAVDCAVRSGAFAHVPSATAALKFHGSSETGNNGDRSLTVYGSDAQAVAALCNERPEVGPAAPSLVAVSCR